MTSDRDGDVLVILAGGRSRRFGSDKALARFGGEGEPLLQRVLRRLETVAPRQVVVRAAPVVGLAPGIVRVADPRPGSGPLQALVAAFSAAPARRRWSVAPCDLPWLEPAVYAKLAAALGDRSVAVARAPDGLEPLVSVWTPRAAVRLADWIAREPELAAHAALDRLERVEVEFEDARPFLNVNTPEDLARAREVDDRAARRTAATIAGDGP